MQLVKRRWPGGSTQIWHLDDVLDWLSARGRNPVAQATLETARLVRQWNLAKEARHLRPDLAHAFDTDCPLDSGTCSR